MDNKNLEGVDSACDWCGSSETELIFTGTDLLEGLPGQFKWVRCCHCGLYRQNPHLEWSSLARYYPDSYSSHGTLVKDQTSFWRGLDRRYGPWKRVRAVEKIQAGGRLLEVGCGTGLFLEEAIRSGRWDVEGIEPTPSAAVYARKNLNVPIHQGLFSDVDFSQDSFDVIALWNVLEHLEHPIADLKYAYRLLKDNGWLIFSLPNLEGLEIKLFGSYWVGWDLPRHLYLFPQDTLQEILETIGFRMVGGRCISSSYALLGDSLNFWSQTIQDKHPVFRKLLMAVYYSLPVRAALVPPLWLLDRYKKSTIITIFAQKIPTHQSEV